MQRSDVYGTDIFNDGITASIREVSPCRDRVCGEFDAPVGKVDCPQYAADAESTDVKWFFYPEEKWLESMHISCHLQH